MSKKISNLKTSIAVFFTVLGLAILAYAIISPEEETVNYTASVMYLLFGGFFLLPSSFGKKRLTKPKKQYEST